MSEFLSKLAFIRTGVVSPELRVADVEFNTSKILEAIDQAGKEICNFLLFPELSISAYTCADLFFQTALIESCKTAINKIRKHLNNKKNIVVVGAPIYANGKLFNCAVVINGSKILGIVPKTFLCNTKEYYEERWFSSDNVRIHDYINWDGEEIPFGADIIFRQIQYPHASFGIEICEDLWSVKSPSFDIALGGAQILLNLSASNEYLSKVDYRRDLVKTQSARCLAAYLFASCGSNESTTDTVFSGHCLITENGKILAETERFKFDTQVAYADIDIEKLNNERILNNSYGNSFPSKPFRIVDFQLEDLNDIKLFRKIDAYPFVPSNIEKRSENCNEIFTIQAVGLSKRLKHTNSKTVVIGLSGGLDSTLALLAASQSFKILNYKQRDIIAVSMPGLGTTARTQGNSEKLAAILNVNFLKIPIEKAVLQHFIDIDHTIDNQDIVFENSQARERTQILMDIANKNNGLVIGTGDLSEIALGWGTYNADHISMYNVNAGVPKSLVRYLIEWAAYNRFDKKVSEILLDICNTPVSPELLPPDSNGNLIQETEKIIGPYELHDFFLYNFLRSNYRPVKIIFLANIAFNGKYKKQEIIKWIKVFYIRFFNNQFKRSCFPDGVKVGSVALSPRADWRMPSDAEVSIWINEIDQLEKNIK